MINFETLEAKIPELREAFRNAEPFEHLIIDDFVEADSLHRALKEVEKAALEDLAARNDNLFQKNKYENPHFDEICPEFKQLRQDYLSDRFKTLLREITGDDVFVDPEFHGGGLHLGVKASKLDMHTDFNYHPMHSDWFRNLNILLFLNDGWQEEHGGQLRFRDDRTQVEGAVEPLFNRAVIMHTRDYTIHGHSMTSFPEGKYRTSIAAYAYDVRAPAQVSSTTWYPEGNFVKRAIGRNWTTLVKIKTKLFGSRTDKLKAMHVANAEKANRDDE